MKLLSVCLYGLCGLLVLLLGGCATMTPDQCRVADWGLVGLHDGQAGAGLDLLAQRTRDCAKAGVQVGSVQYLQGRGVGLQSYCLPDNAVREGLQGRGYAGVCPAAVDGLFRQRWQTGLAVYNARAELAVLQARRRDLEWRLYAGASDEERHYIRHELFELDYRFALARERLREAQWNLSHLP